MNLKLLEFIYIHSNMPRIGLFDAENITSIQQVDDKHCQINFKSSSVIQACGTYRNLTNRWMYALHKKTNNYYDDTIIRPSEMIFHRPDNLEADSVYFSRYELEQLTLALKPELLDKIK